LARNTNATSINLIAHSLGSDVVLEALSPTLGVSRSGAPISDLKLNEMIFAAPDVGRTAFADLAEKLRTSVKGGITLYASASDRAMKVSRTVSIDIIRAGDVPSEGPLIVPGVETIDVTQASLSFFQTNHSSFAERRHLMTDMKMLLESSRRPPDARLPVFEAIRAKAGMFWRYIAN
jgi:esterase/lipase superfamily enzyme